MMNYSKIEKCKTLFEPIEVGAGKEGIVDFNRFFKVVAFNFFSVY
jgi:hypothetical protein